jgi:UDP:flavonoid glycosyltransferase YjiC (YdhE family)
MKVLLTAFGSTGDVYPIIAYGRALEQQGHKVVFATQTIYEAEVVKAGLEFFRVPPHWSQQEFADFMAKQSKTALPILQLRNLYKAAAEEFLEELFERLDEALRDCDAMITSYMFPTFGIVAKRLNKPFALFYFCHNFIPTSAFAMEGFPPAPRKLPLRLKQAYNRRTWALSSELIDNSLNNVLEGFLKEHNIPPVHGWLTDPAPLGIVAVSKVLKDRRGIEDPRYVFTGYLRWQSPESPELEKELTEFCAGEKVPVLTFGSVSFGKVEQVMKRFCKHWPKGKKFILQSGWAGLTLPEERPDIKIVGKVSHDQLFKFASCVIHHGGAGTTASVMYAGKPHIVVPHFADQPFFASEIKRLGIGIKIPKTRWPERLPAAVREIEENPRYALAAEGLMPKVRAENGPLEAVQVLEKFVAEWKGWPQPTYDRYGKTQPPF